jgi:formylglycine-generating enzyme
VPRLDRIAWYDENCGADFELHNGAHVGRSGPLKRGGSHPVKRKAPNPFGLYDMLGNVFEWCEDAEKGYTSHNVDDPRPAEPHSRSFRVCRGGSCFSYEYHMRAALRVSFDSSNCRNIVGLRLAQGPAPGKKRKAR